VRASQCIEEQMSEMEITWAVVRGRRRIVEQDKQWFQSIKGLIPTLPKHSPSLIRPENRCHLGLPLCLRPRLMLLARDVEVEKMSVGTHGWGDEQKKDFALRISHPPHRTTEAFRSTIENRGDGSREPPPIKCRELLPMPLPTFPQFFSVSKTGA
jgi:hypothetical protein